MCRVHTAIINFLLLLYNVFLYTDRKIMLKWMIRVKFVPWPQFAGCWKHGGQTEGGDGG